MYEEKLFTEAYTRDEMVFGTQPSRELIDFLRQSRIDGEALVLGAGLGRNALALAQRGHPVTAVDLSEVAIDRLHEIASDMGVCHRVNAIVGDARHIGFDDERFAVVVAATVLDHVPADDARQMLPCLVRSLLPYGVAFIEVHTVDDPGCTDVGPASECAAAVRHYYEPNELLRLAGEHLRIIRYEERFEWDETHGPAHLHGKAALLGVRPDAKPQYFGIPAVRTG
jgi:SAM-dependent methyltransferase